MSCRTDITEPIEFLPDGIEETVLEEADFSRSQVSVEMSSCDTGQFTN
jgi:hypothetical protein